MERENIIAPSINIENLCRNSIDLIQYARQIAAKQVNLVQLMTYYSIGRWIVEEQQQGKSRADLSFIISRNRPVIPDMVIPVYQQSGDQFHQGNNRRAGQGFDGFWQSGFPEFSQQQKADTSGSKHADMAPPAPQQFQSNINTAAQCKNTQDS